MKKKLFILAIMIITVMSVFAITANALTQIPEFTEVIDVTKTSDKVLNPINTSALASQVQGDNNSRVLLRDANGDYQTYLTKYITQFNGGYSDGSQFVAYFDALNTATGKGYDVTSIVCIEIPEGTLRVSNTYSKTSTWTNLMYVKAPSTLVYQQYTSYNACSNLKVLDYSKASITNLDQEFITNNSSIEVVYYPASVQKIGKWSLHGTSKLSSVYVPASLQSAESMISDATGSGKFVFFYTGSIDEGTGKTPLYTILGKTNVKEIAWDSSKEDSYYIEQAKSDCIYIVYDYNHCKAFNNNVHDYKGTGSCIDGVKCEICNKTIAGTSGHQMAETLTFANGITAEGIHIEACQNDGCTVKTEETVNAVFTAKGYSTNDDKNAINGGYEVNPTSLALYERLIGELKYGIIIANANAFGEKTFLDENNKVNSDKALQVEMDKQYASFDCSINFGTNTDIDLDLVICAYVIEGDTVTYIQSSTGEDTTIGGESFKSVTLSQVVALAPAEIKEN
ncbi:MAG: leucine-rich repeat protein [Clostridia bacterium]|nr:leucine-rich repeat protein [Clostridia bacterium]